MAVPEDTDLLEKDPLERNAEFRASGSSFYRKRRTGGRAARSAKVMAPYGMGLWCSAPCPEANGAQGRKCPER